MYPLFFTIKYSQGQTSCSCTEETEEKEGRVGVVCESDLGRHLFIDIACSNAVGELAIMTLKMCMIVNWQVCARKISWLTLR